ncbi:MAG TPA: methylated-DNA--[protein]-cysteine S-methyltransferase [Longimicrobiales bacterium]|nr:methylated-DNA--[protein]-cysteine S-methyltransferase [Longimicrobiales bacterium]
MRCEDVMERLDALRTGELDAADASAVTSHLGSCDECRDAGASLATLAVRLRARPRPAPREILAGVLDAAAERFGVVATDAGPAWVGWSPRGVTFVRLGEDADAFAEAYREERGRAPRSSEVPARYADAVRRALAGEPAADVPLDLSALPAYERETLEALRRIPRGEVRPYAWLARETGRPRAARAVGNALARNPVPLLLPCHRVVPSGGGTGRYIFGAPLKRELLRREGVPVDEVEALARRGVRFLGCRTTGIYCHPTCHDIRRARPENRVPLADERAAAAAGFRPCQHCRPTALAA